MNRSRERQEFPAMVGTKKILTDRSSGPPRQVTIYAGSINRALNASVPSQQNARRHAELRALEPCALTRELSLTRESAFPSRGLKTFPLKGQIVYRSQFFGIKIKLTLRIMHKDFSASPFDPSSPFNSISFQKFPLQRNPTNIFLVYF